MDYELISQTALFQGCSPSETEKLLHGLKTFTKKYKKGAPVYLAGTPVTDIGIVLYGTVQIENNDLWGNKNIISLAHTGEVFAEAYACVPGEPMMVDVIAMEEAEILFLNVPELFRLSAAGKGEYSHLIHAKTCCSHAASYTPLPRRSAIVCSPIFPIRQDCRKTVTSTFR